MTNYLIFEICLSFCFDQEQKVLPNPYFVSVYCHRHAGSVLPLGVLGHALVWGRRQSSQHPVGSLLNHVMHVARVCLHSRLWSSQQSCFHLHQENSEAQRNFKGVASHLDRGKQSWKNSASFPKGKAAAISTGWRGASGDRRGLSRC